MLRLFRRGVSTEVRAGIMQDGSRVELAVVRRLDDGAFSLVARNIELQGGAWTAGGVDDLQSARVFTVLGADAYSLQLVETPNVPEAEMQEAVRWRIQHLIESPIDEVAVEVFEMPAPANPGNKPMVYAVVAHRDEIARQIERSKSAHLQMDVIDIPELCMRNVAVRLPQDMQGVAFMHFTDDCGYLTITRRGVLYMIRRIETRRAEIADVADDAFVLQERSAGVALEVQRSLDYYESHYDSQPISHLVLGPGDNLDGLAVSLEDSLGITVSRLDLADLFVLPDEIQPQVQSDCLLAVGAALRSDNSEIAGAVW